jgi:hypothetical protein
MILLGCVIVHRLNQFFTAKDDLENGYPSLQHFRKAASKRSTFHNTLLQTVNAIKQSEVFSMDSRTAISSKLITGALARRNDTRVKEVHWGNVSTGATPQHSVKNGMRE